MVQPSRNEAPGPPSAPDDLSAAIEATVREWSGVLRRAARRFSLTDEEHEEVVQEVRLRVWRALERRGGRGEGLLPSYGYSAAVSAAIDLLRKRRSGLGTRLLPLEAVEETLAAPATAGQDELEMMATLERGLAALDGPRRVAVQLHLRGRSLEEIARISGWTPAKARNLLYRGLENLREVVEHGRRGPE